MSELAKYLRHNFKYDTESRAKLLAILAPCETWLEQYENSVAAIVGNYEIGIISTLEGCGNRFLRKNLDGVWPATKGAQKAYLTELDYHASALIELIARNPAIDGTIADPYRFLEKAFDGKPSADRHTRQSALMTLVALQYFARFRLTENVQPLDDEAVEEKTKRKSTYPRLVLFADLLAVYVRITDRRPKATARVDKDGTRRVSEAVDFLSIAAPPIIKAARLEKISAITDDQTIANDIAEINRLWEAKKRPELSYGIPDWGKHFS